MLDKSGICVRNDRVSALDETKGFRWHIITGGNHVQKFNEVAGVYGRDFKGRFCLKDDDLRDRRILRVHNPEEIFQFMQRRDTPRVTNSRVVFNNRAVNWDDFFLHLEKTERYAALIDNLRNLRKGTPSQAVLMELVVERMPTVLPFSTHFPFRARPIDIGREDREGRRHYVVPAIRVVHNHNTHIRDMFIQAGRYFVLGVPRLTTKKYDHAVYHYLNMTVNHENQACFVNIRDITEAAKNNAERRARKQGETPSAP